MTKSQSTFFKVILMVLGLGIIFAAFKLFNTAETLTDSQKFFWINLAVIYVVFFFPLFFNTITLNNFDKKIPSLVGLWFCLSLFEFVTLVLSIVVLMEKLQVRIAFIIEAALFFFCAIFIYFAYVGNTHIANVQQEEERALSLISKIRSSFDMLKLKSETLGDSSFEAKKKINSLADEVRYISPVDTAESAEIESKIIAKISEVESQIDEVTSGGNSANLAAALTTLELLIKQRKLLRR